MINNLLLYLILLPIIAAFAIMICHKVFGEYTAKLIALTSSLLEFALSVYIYFKFDPEIAGMQFETSFEWIPQYNINFSLGIDAISLYLLMLTTFLIPICIIASWQSITRKPTFFLALFLLLEGSVIGTFCATDLILFYLFFESGLAPLFFIIGMWGGNDRIYASFKFFIYTFLGSLFMLLGIIYIYNLTGTTNIVELVKLLPYQPLSIQKMLWWAFFASFAIKLPMWPFHTWLPDAHVEAPTAGSVILAGVLLKLGGYGFIRISLPMLPYACISYQNTIFWLSIIGVIYTSLIALVQQNIKKLVAYSSIAHMGFVTSGIFSGNVYGLQGAIFQMISHGLISSGLFLCVGALYERAHSKEISFYNGLTSQMPKFSLVFTTLTMASIALPGTSGFIGEFLVLLSVSQHNIFYCAMLSLSMVLGAAYMLRLLSKVIFSKMTNAKLKNMVDLKLTEKLTLYPLVVLIIIIGIYPKIITNNITLPATKLLNILELTNPYMINNLN
jgi:NADH-quinone oxidoreductase subunit M